MAYKPTWKTSDDKQTLLPQSTKKKALCCQRTLLNKNKHNSLNNEQERILNKKGFDVIPSNPYCKEIDRHFGSFETRLLGNHLSIFDSLPFPSLVPLGRKGIGCKRKLLKQESFTAVFYGNGTVIIKIARTKDASLFAPEVLQKDYFDKAREAKRFLECYSFSLAELKMNQLPKYGVEDLTARVVKKEVDGEFRSMDSSTRIVNGKVVRRVPHIDNKSATAASRDAQFSSEQAFELAKARLNNPEFFTRLESKIDVAVEVSTRYSKNINLHLAVEEKNLENAVKLNRLLSAPRVPRFFSTSLSKSASVRGCS